MSADAEFNKVFTIREAADFLRVSAKTVQRLVERNHLPAYKVGRSVRISDQAIREYLSRNSTQKG